jgi:hypothetical protein
MKDDDIEIRDERAKSNQTIARHWLLSQFIPLQV